MEFSKQQVLLLLDKFKSSTPAGPYTKENIANIEWADNSYGDITEIKVKTGQKSLHISMSEHTLRIKLDGPAGELKGYYETPKGIFKLFSKPWRKWMSIRFKLERYIDAICDKKEAEEKIKANEKFNHIVYTTYPDELDKILLGDDHDE